MTEPKDPSHHTLCVEVAAFRAAYQEYKLRVDERFVAAAQALDIASKALSSRLDALNELRAMVNDQQVKFASAEKVTFLEGQISDLSSRLDKSSGRSTGTAAVWGWFVAIAGLLVAAAAVFIK